jgi:expansin (peptidoglycan-binding protein)
MRALSWTAITLAALGACSGSGAGGDSTGDPVSMTGGTTTGGTTTGGTTTGGMTTTGGGPTVPGPGDMSVNLGGNDSSCKPDTQEHTGDGTYYTFADGGGNCGFPPTPNDLLVGAMNHTDYAASAVCGSCVALTGPKGMIKIRIVDQCPECKPGDIDLSPMAFDLMADHAAGRVKINWHYIACQSMGPIVYHFKDGSNAYWTAVQIRNHRYAIKSFAYQTKDGSFKEAVRQDYNYFLDDKGMGPGPYTIRVTDVYDHVIEDTGIALKDNADSPGMHQFPECTGM